MKLCLFKGKRVLLNYKKIKKLNFEKNKKQIFIGKYKKKEGKIKKEVRFIFKILHFFYK